MLVLAAQPPEEIVSSDSGSVKGNRCRGGGKGSPQSPSEEGAGVNLQRLRPRQRARALGNLPLTVLFLHFNSFCLQPSVSFGNPCLLPGTPV